MRRSKRAKRRKCSIPPLERVTAALRRLIMTYLTKKELLCWLIAYPPDRIQASQWWNSHNLSGWNCYLPGAAPAALVDPRLYGEAMLSRFSILVQLPDFVDERFVTKPAREMWTYCTVCRRGNPYQFETAHYASSRGPCYGQVATPFVCCKHCYKVYVHPIGKVLYKYDLRPGEAELLPRWTFFGKSFHFHAEDKHFVLVDRRTQLRFEQKPAADAWWCR